MECLNQRGIVSLSPLVKRLFRSYTANLFSSNSFSAYLRYFVTTNFCLNNGNDIRLPASFGFETLYAKFESKSTINKERVTKSDGYFNVV